MPTIEAGNLSAVIESFEPNEVLVTDTQRESDRWILSSNLQKSIRRGLPEIACQSATQLACLNEPYLYRRLLVIAFEDVGLADPGLCLSVLRLFRRTALRRELGDAKVLQYLVTRMCEAIKSRSLCDVIASIGFNKHIDLSGCGPQNLIEIATSDEYDFEFRAAACRQLCGWTEFVGGFHRQRAMVNRNAMHVIADRMCLTEDERALFLSGNNNSELMNVSLPLVAELFRLSMPQALPAQKLDSEGHDGVLFAALDRHTRAGKQCIQIMAARHSKVLSSIRRPADTLAVALFITEGAQLNKSIDSSRLTAIRAAFEKNFFAYYGSGVQEAAVAVQLMVEQRFELNALRLGALT